MTPSAVQLYDEGLRTQPGLRPSAWWLRYRDGSRHVLDIARWTGAPTPADELLLDRCAGATLDVGCGPGRLTVGLKRRGLPALGIDIAPEALRLAVGRGASVMHASVFGDVPGAGRWTTVLLADGNIGIGGRPVSLLQRCRELMSGDGAVLCEVDAPGSPHREVEIRLESGDRRSRWFPWAHVGVDQIHRLAGEAALRVADVWEVSDRWFATLGAT